MENNQHVIIEFFKPHCPACNVLAESYEEFASVVRDIQKYWRDVEQNRAQYNKFDNNIINTYHIKNPAKFMNLKVGRYNIYNEVTILQRFSSIILYSHLDFQVLHQHH